MDTSLSPIMLESDVELSSVCSEIGLIISSVLGLMDRIHNSSVSYVPRQANKVAHHLNKLALSVVSDCCRIEECHL
ncbi:hypothetical protein ACOSQ4_031561 [Xanthoceras sorbifolium]